MRHKLMLVTVKEWLKSVLNYRSYPQNKTGYPLFDHPPPCRWSTIDWAWAVITVHVCPPGHSAELYDSFIDDFAKGNRRLEFWM